MESSGQRSAPGAARASHAMAARILLAATLTANAAALNAHALLRPVSVLRATDGSAVKLTDEWAADERAVVVLMRSFG